MTHRIGRINGQPAVVTCAGDRVAFVTSVDADGKQVFAFYGVLDPDKLRRVAGGGAE